MGMVKGEVLREGSGERDWYRLVESIPFLRVAIDELRMSTVQGGI